MREPAGDGLDIPASRNVVRGASLRDVRHRVEWAAEFAGFDPAEIDGTPLRFRQPLVATGAAPVVPPIPGLRDVDYLTSETVWDLLELPAELVVLGGGTIGCELGQSSPAPSWRPCYVGFVGPREPPGWHRGLAGPLGFAGRLGGAGRALPGGAGLAGELGPGRCLTRVSCCCALNTRLPAELW